jgi:NTP pyrophosphatase (non-canonical NTP hydrolase)
MNTKEYIENVLKTESNDFDKIGERLDNIKTERLLHAGIGLVTEAGEFIDMLKKHIFYGKLLDFVNLKEELGDLLWYVAIAAHELGEASFEGIMETNIAKLKARYGDKFGETQAENRDLVKEREILEKPLSQDMFGVIE